MHLVLTESSHNYWGRIMTTLAITPNEDKINNREGIISILENIQARYGYLPEKELRTVAEETGKSLVDIYGVATFYKSFSLKPRGKHVVSVCLGTACHVRGGPTIEKEFEHRLNVRPGETTKDKDFTLETVACYGHYFSKVITPKVKQILDKTREGLDKVEIKTDQRIFPVEISCARCNHSLMDPDHLVDYHPSIRVTISFERKHGWLRLSSLYGSYNIESEYEIPDNTVVNFFCPHCHTELRGAANCVECGSPMVPMIVKGGGVIQICSRRGCKGHMLDLSGGIYG